MDAVRPLRHVEARLPGASGPPLWVMDWHCPSHSVGGNMGSAVVHVAEGWHSAEIQRRASVVGSGSVS